MSAYPPPTPPANRTTKGPGPTPASHKDLLNDTAGHPAKAPNNLKEEGERGNMRENTTNTGYQQDR